VEAASAIQDSKGGTSTVTDRRNNLCHTARSFSSSTDYKKETRTQHATREHKNLKPRDPPPNGSIGWTSNDKPTPELCQDLRSNPNGVILGRIRCVRLTRLFNDRRRDFGWADRRSPDGC
jgi:hypothetical protein